MVADHVLPSVRTNVLPNVIFDVLRDVTIKASYFSLVATTFVFVLILLTGMHP